MLAALETLADKTTEEKLNALESLVGQWLTKAGGERDRASLVREATALFRLQAELRREIRVAGTADVNVLIVERDRALGELAERERLWDAEMAVIVGALAAFPDARREVIKGLERARVHAAFDARGGPGYPALPAPERAGGEPPDTPDNSAIVTPGTKGTTPPLGGSGVDTMDSGCGAAAADGSENPTVGVDPGPPAQPEDEDRPKSIAEQMCEQGIKSGMGGLQPNRAAGRRGDGSRDEILPDGSRHERARGRYGDEPPW